MTDEPTQRPTLSVLLGAPGRAARGRHRRHVRVAIGPLAILLAAALWVTVAYAEGLVLLWQEVFGDEAEAALAAEGAPGAWAASRHLAVLAMLAAIALATTLHAVAWHRVLRAPPAGNDGVRVFTWSGGHSRYFLYRAVLFSIVWVLPLVFVVIGEDWELGESGQLTLGLLALAA